MLPCSVMASNVVTEVSFNLSQEYSDNIFKLDSENPLYEVVDNSDVITQAGAGISLTKAVSNQEFNLQANFLQNGYKNNSQLDNQSNVFAFDWGWGVGSVSRGNVGYRHVEQLKDFEDQIGIEKNSEKTGVMYFNGQIDLFSRAAFNVDIENSAKRNQLESKKGFDRDELTRLISLEYKSSPKLDYVVGQIHTKGQASQSSVDSPYDFEQDKLFVGVNYFSGSKTNLSLSAGSVERRIAGQDSVEANDLSFEWLWRLSSKSALDLGVSKRLTSPSSESVSYTESDVFDMSFTYQLSSKIGVGLSYKREERVSELIGESQSLEEHLDSLALNLNYRIKPYLGLVFNVKDLGRTSSAAQSDYDVQTLFLGMNLTL